MKFCFMVGWAAITLWEGSQKEGAQGSASFWRAWEEKGEAEG